MCEIGLQTPTDFAIESLHQSHIGTLPSHIHEEIEEDDRNNQHLVLIKLQCFQIELEGLPRGLGLLHDHWLWLLQDLGRRSGERIEGGFFVNDFLCFLGVSKEGEEEEGEKSDFYVHGY